VAAAGLRARARPGSVLQLLQLALTRRTSWNELERVGENGATPLVYLHLASNASRGVVLLSTEALPRGARLGAGCGRADRAPSHPRAGPQAAANPCQSPRTPPRALAYGVAHTRRRHTEHTRPAHASPPPPTIAPAPSAAPNARQALATQPRALAYVRGERGSGSPETRVLRRGRYSDAVLGGAAWIMGTMLNGDRSTALPLPIITATFSPLGATSGHVDRAPPAAQASGRAAFGPET
jgi:hypothetical protein